MSNYVKGTKYLENGEIDRAYKFLNKALKAGEYRAECLVNLGAIYKGRGMLKKAYAYFCEAMLLKPDWEIPYNNAGLVLHNWGREEEACRLFRRAISLKEDYADAHWNLGLSLLKQGYSGRTELLEEGWEKYSWRFRKSGPVKLAYKPSFAVGTTGRCLVIPEQGIGDYIMFSSGLEDNMVVADLDRFSDIAEVLGIKTGSVDAEYDTWIPMCSLKPKKVERVASGGSKVYVCWAGNPEHGNDKHRSLRDSDFSWLDAESIQFGVKSKIFGEYTGKSWIDTFKALSDCKLLVTVDTSVAHLAGWMGIPTCCLVPSIDTDFRWGMKRNDNEWYSSVYIARSMQEVKDYVNSFTG